MGYLSAQFRVYTVRASRTSREQRTSSIFPIYPSDNGAITIERGAVASDPQGNIDFTINTGDGNYSAGAYSILASYTYWGPRRDPYASLIVCDFCPLQTVSLADPISFILDPN